MGCAEFEEGIGEFALGRQGALDARERAEVRAHLARCVACREELARIREFYAALRGGAPGGRHGTSPSVGERGHDARRAVPEWPRGAKRGVPEEVLAGTHDGVMSALRARRGRVETWRSVGVAAAAVALWAGMVWWFGGFAALFGAKPSSPVAQAPGPTTPGTPVSPSPVTTPAASPAPVASPAEPDPLVKAFDAIDQPSKALALLRKTFQAEKNRPDADLRRFATVLRLCERLRERWPESGESLAAMKLISRCHTQRAEPRLARDTFLAYADEAGRRAQRREPLKDTEGRADAAVAQRVTGRLIVLEAERHASLNDGMTAMTYCDLALTRYPGSDAARKATYIMAQYCLRRRLFAEAARLLLTIIEEAPGSDLARLARGDLPSALFNSGRRDEAVKAWLAYAELAESPADKACGQLNAGVLAVARGGAHLDQARKIFRAVARQFPHTPYAETARAELARLVNTSTRGLMDLGGRNILDVLDTDKLPPIKKRPNPRPKKRDILKIKDALQILDM